MNEEEMVHCPYNFSHVILKSRFATHLVKCSQQHITQDYYVCPLNTTHRVPIPYGMEKHFKTCPEYKKWESDLYVIGDAPRGGGENIIHNVELPPSNENWDEDNTVTGSYLDVKNEVVKNQPIFRVPVGMSKAQRKAFFKEEVQKFEKISSGQNLQSTIGGSTQVAKVNSKASLNTKDSHKNFLEDESDSFTMRSKGRGKGCLFDSTSVNK